MGCWVRDLLRRGERRLGLMVCVLIELNGTMRFNERAHAVKRGADASKPSSETPYEIGIFAVDVIIGHAQVGTEQAIERY